MTKLIEIWSWVKLNAVVLAVAAAICAGATAFAYFKGRDHGQDACAATYERLNSQGKDDVIARLDAIQKEAADLRKQWEAENAATNAEVKEKIVYVDRILEKTVEVPVAVTGPCAIDYGGVARMFDAASEPASTFNY